MTKEEIKKFLDNTKVYVNGKSKEIQEKLFSFGYKWDRSNSTDVHNTDKPFLFIGNNRNIAYAINMDFFVEQENKEITADEILAIEVTEPSYRPFKSQEECWQEMQKHIPFGWLKSKQYGTFLCIGEFQASKNFIEGIIFSTEEMSVDSYEEVFEEYMFADGVPFGIKED